jgi:hypothetical protein
VGAGSAQEVNAIGVVGVLDRHVLQMLAFQGNLSLISAGRTRF